MEKLSIIKQNYINYIDKIIDNNKVSHAYLIEIDNYEEDLKYVYDFIKMIICDSSYEKVLKVDTPVIKQIDDGNYPDIKVVEPEGSTIKKNQMLELQKEYSNKSLLDGKRIYLVKEAEKLNPASANTMLKFLEEPEENIVAILLTDNRYHVIDTILSRCQVLTLKEDNTNIEEDNDLVDLLKCVLAPNDFFIKYNYFVNNYITDKEIAKDKLIIIEKIIINYLNNKYLNGEVFDNKLLPILEKIDNKKLLNSLSIIEEELPKLEFNVNYKLWLDSLFSKFAVGG